MSTASRMAATPSRTWAISRSSGPRTAATMQNSVAPVAAVWRAASTSEGMSSRTARTGLSKRPDCEQKWQSSGQPPVLTLTIPSTSTSGPHQRMRTSCASASASSIAVVVEPQDLQHLGLAQPLAALEHLLAGDVEDRRHACTSSSIDRLAPSASSSRPGMRPAPSGSRPSSGAPA